MPRRQDIPLRYAARNLLRRIGVEVVPGQANSSLLAMHLKLLFSELKINCVLDVGARCGEYGLYLRRNGYRGNIISFEPVPVNFTELAAAAAHDPHWHCCNYALGAEDSVASINVTKVTHLSSFRQPNAAAAALFGEAPEVERTEKVEIRRLDSVLDTLPTRLDSRTYLKLDTQGWDLEVLAGAQRTLDCVAALQAEIAVQPIYAEMPLMQDSLSAIAGYGFTPSGFFPVTLDAAMRVIELDLVAVRSASAGDPQGQ
jgi:FkbM family methyltransferase